MYLRDSSLSNEIEFTFWKDWSLMQDQRFSSPEHADTADVEKEGDIP